MTQLQLLTLSVIMWISGEASQTPTIGSDTETARLLTLAAPYSAVSTFRQVEEAETVIWLTEVAPSREAWQRPS